MSTVIIIYDAKCKHCVHFSSKKNKNNKRQSFCKLKEIFITLKDKACEKLEL